MGCIGSRRLSKPCCSFLLSLQARGRVGVLRGEGEERGSCGKGVGVETRSSLCKCVCFYVCEMFASLSLQRVGKLWMYVHRSCIHSFTGKISEVICVEMCYCVCGCISYLPTYLPNASHLLIYDAVWQYVYVCE